MTAPERERRLPLWAQQELARLRADLATAQRTAQAMTAAEPTRTSLRAPGLRAYLPDLAAVRYQLAEQVQVLRPDRTHGRTRLQRAGAVTMQLGLDTVQVYAEGGALAVWPVSSNVAELGVLYR